jgi:hypothetical protein
MQEKPGPKSDAAQDPEKIDKAAALSELFHLRGGLVCCTQVSKHVVRTVLDSREAETAQAMLALESTLPHGYIGERRIQH